MLLNNTFFKNYTDKYKNSSNTIGFSTASLLLQKTISLGSLKPQVIQVDKTEKMNQEMLFKDVYCNQVIFNWLQLSDHYKVLQFFSFGYQQYAE